MKTKIANALKTRYANLGLGEKAFNGVAAFLEKTVTNESDIENAVSGEDVKMLLQSIQGETDSIRSAKSSIEKQLEELRKSQPIPPAPKPTDDKFDKLQELIIKMAERQDAMEAKTKAEEKRKSDAEVIAKVHEIMKKGGSTNDFIRNMTLKGLEVAEGDTAESLAEKFKPVYDANFTAAYGDGPAPMRGTQVSGDYHAGDFKAMAERFKASGAIPDVAK